MIGITIQILWLHICVTYYLWQILEVMKDIRDKPTTL